MKTVNVRWMGARTTAYADADGVVRVYDDVAGYYVRARTLTEGQMRYIRARARNQ